MAAKLLNEVTGEAVITDSAGREYHVVFDLTAVMAVEQLTGRGAVDVALGGMPSASACVAMILAGTAGYARRQPGAPKVNPNLAQRILVDSGGVAGVGRDLCVSLAHGEGLGLTDDEPGSGDEAGPLVSPAL